MQFAFNHQRLAFGDFGARFTADGVVIIDLDIAVTVIIDGGTLITLLKGQVLPFACLL